MKRILMMSAAAISFGGMAQAGGIDRSGQGLGFLFEKGTYGELSIGSVAPSVSGISTPTYGSRPSGDMAGDYTSLSIAYKQDLSDRLSVGLIVDQPFGADVSYPVGTGYYAQGSVAELDTVAITGLLKYTTDTNFSVYGGLRYQTLSATATVPFVASYDVDGSKDGGLGYVIGAAWEKPEIALRVALTYNSSIKHELNTSDASLLSGGAYVSSITPIETPQSVNLDFQTGIAKDTLVFGGVRWVDWSAFVIDPPNYPAPSPLVSYDSDTISYSLGIGRRLNEKWSVAATLGYEKPTKGYSSNLGPNDGYSSFGLGATYTKGNMKITAGVRYVDVGKAQTTLDGGVSTAGNFTSNHAVGAGIKVGWSF
ncbi:MAG: outer membrane protein transport protein [Paracoccaceae bacterium]